MKKLFALFLMLVALTVSVMAQTTTPRTRTGASYNPGYLNYAYNAVTDVAGADSFAVSPNAYITTYRIVLTDSLTAQNPTVTNSYAGDEIQLIVSAASGTPKLKFTGSNWQGAGTATLSTGLRAVLTFVFDGAKYVEKSRVVQ